jgi:hypothetical protein
VIIARLLVSQPYPLQALLTVPVGFFFASQALKSNRPAKVPHFSLMVMEHFNSAYAILST